MFGMGKKKPEPAKAAAPRAARSGREPPGVATAMPGAEHDQARAHDRP